MDRIASGDAIDREGADETRDAVGAGDAARGRRGEAAGEEASRRPDAGGLVWGPARGCERRRLVIP